MNLYLYHNVLFPTATVISISTLAPLGNCETATQNLAGGLYLKYCP